MSKDMKLLPCPFCGGEAEVIEVDYGMYETGYAVYCSKCCMKLGVTGRIGEAYKWSAVFGTEAEAIEAWNTRAERTCRMGRIEDGKRILHSWLECSECGPVYPPANERIQDAVKFCPFCGRRVVA